MGADVKKLGAYITRKVNGGTIWVSAGVAFVNRDASITVTLDVLPIDGKLHLREIATQPNEADLIIALNRMGDFATHKSGCRMVDGAAGSTCDCGFYDAIDKARAALAGSKS